MQAAKGIAQGNILFRGSSVVVNDVKPLLARKPYDAPNGTVAKLAMRQPFVLFKGLTFQKLCLPGAFRPGDHHNKMLRPGLCVVHASPQYL
nr:cellulose biosynthesis cyclic di-GMP-binding regulatory protein BcsB [Salmonella enterica]